MDQGIQICITVVCSVIASSGFWAFLNQRSGRKNAQAEMLIGLGHDRILYLGIKYLERGSITYDEYENLHDYLYIPYANMGGNGSAKHIMDEVNKLKVTKSTYAKGGSQYANK